MKFGKFIHKSVTGIVAISCLVVTIWGLNNSANQFVTPTPVEAYETTCPAGLSDQDCLKYLQDQAAQISQAKKSLEGQVSKEKFDQMSLSQQINYLNGQITARKTNINELEVNLESLNIEIRILTSDIATIQDNLNTITQETNTLKASIDKRVSISYKFNRSSTLEVLLSSEDIDQAMRKMKYLSEARKKDKEILEQYTIKYEEQKAEEAALAKKKADVETARTGIEDTKTRLYNENLTLAAQKSQQEGLVAQSKAREREYNNQIAALKAQQNTVDNQTTQLIMKLFNSGQMQNGTPVKQGDIVGFQGHTGCSYGSHLHFGIGTKSGNQWVTNVNPFNGYLGVSGNYLTAGSAKTPMDSAYITQNFHSGYYLDLVSTSRGVQGGACWLDHNPAYCYEITKGSLKCDPNASGWFSLQGEGAPVYSIYDGTVYYGVDSWGGAKYALVVHNNGLISMYVHLR